MEILDFKNSIEYSKLEKASKVLKKGGLVLFPTETVYGIGANGLDIHAVKKIFLAKGRKQDNPLILHVSDFDMISVIACNITEIEKKLMHAFWPGPFTIILNKTSIVPNIVTGGLDTVAVRMPSNKIAQALIKYSEVPVAAPSANISGKPSGTLLDDILDELQDKVDYIIDGGPCDVGLESTVVRVINNVPHILRPGKITPEQIKQVAGDVVIDKHILHKFNSEKPVLSPGMKYRHYAPDSKCVLVYSVDNNKMVDKINELSKNYKNSLVICCNENSKYYSYAKTLTYGIKSNLESISKNIFSSLRKVDNYNPDIVFIEGVESSGLGLAIMNRLIRACEYNYIEI
ncbi:MAG: threonylcarbamoyl-AMP synthase [Clostridia bacterium]|nr:threonylcarbamoyl-AMP synthase [Clostridia bacterium]